MKEEEENHNNITLKTKVKNFDVCMEEKEMKISNGENLSLLVHKFSRFLKYKSESILPKNNKQGQGPINKCYECLSETILNPIVLF